MAEYNFRELEKKWQQYWQENKTFRAENQSVKPKYYVLDMFPYPSGAGLHVGHPLGYIATDIVARYKRLKGFNVLHPMGFDAFGLPAEQYALQTGQHPAITTSQNIDRYKEQLKNIGFSFDWDRELRTSEPDYYRWTQWIFGALFNHWFNYDSNKAEPIESLMAYFSQFGTENLRVAADEKAISFSASDWNSWSEKQQQLELLNYRLAFPAELTVNWCPGLGTVLANEEVKDGLSERGGFPVIRKEMRQWCLRITAYADRLLAGLDEIDFSEAVKEMQRNWIGRSTGASLKFKIENSDKVIEVFTTRIDTTFGVTFLSLAPEHELVASLTTEAEFEKVGKYVELAKNRSELDRMSDVKHISGAFTGSFAINPFNGAKIPIWVADYVLAGYGTGAVMAVPSSDTRDYAFAKHFNLPIIQVQEGPGTDISAPDFDAKAGKMINSGFLDGLTVKEAIQKAIEFAETNGFGKARINYRFRDAIFSRQRYWGEPIPIYYKDDIPYLLPSDKLPLILPEVDAYKPTESGEPPLGRAKNWQTSKGYPLETNTMPGWAGSSWYFLRYMDNQNNNEPFDKSVAEYWNQVDLYIGGSEHATGHLLYARFWTHFLNDLGLISFREPFKKLVNQGMIQGVSEKVRFLVSDSAETKYQFLSADANEEVAGDFIAKAIDFNVDISLVNNKELDLGAFIKWRPEYASAKFITSGGYWQNGSYTKTSDTGSDKFLCFQEVEKMSKSKFNVVNPDEIVERYGADTLRMYEMFLGPLEQFKPWNTHGIEGTWKFLRKFWRLFHNNKTETFTVSNESPSAEELKILHKTIKKVAEDIERLSLNTAVPTFMVCVNDLQTLQCNKRAILEPLTIVLSPYAPHLCEEIWALLGFSESISTSAYPEFREEYLVENTFECPISINGKVRAKLTFALNRPAAEIEMETLANEAVQRWLEGKTPKKVIVVPNKIVNVVV